MSLAKQVTPKETEIASLKAERDALRAQVRPEEKGGLRESRAQKRAAHQTQREARRSDRAL